MLSVEPFLQCDYSMQHDIEENSLLSPYKVETQRNSSASEPHIPTRNDIDSINDFMCLNILANLFCCWMIGLIAVSRSAKCQEAKKEGNLKEAKRYSSDAKQLFVLTIVCGIIMITTIVLFVVKPNL